MELAKFADSESPWNNSKNEAITWCSANVRNVLSLCNWVLPTKVCRYCIVLFLVLCLPMLDILIQKFKYSDNRLKMSGFSSPFKAAWYYVVVPPQNSRAPRFEPPILWIFEHSIHKLFFTAIFQYYYLCDFINSVSTSRDTINETKMFPWLHVSIIWSNFL